MGLIDLPHFIFIAMEGCMDDRCEGAFDVPVGWASKCDLCGGSLRSHFTDEEYENYMNGNQPE